MQDQFSKQVLASGDQVVLKRPAAASASGDQVVLNKPASASASGGVHSELDSAEARLFCQNRAQLHGERVHCSPDTCDELKRALSALRGSKSQWTQKGWIEAVSLNIRTCDWGAVSHGGDRRSGGCQSHGSPGAARGTNFVMNASPTTISRWR